MRQTLEEKMSAAKREHESQLRDAEYKRLQVEEARRKQEALEKTRLEKLVLYTLSLFDKIIIRFNNLLF